MGDNITVAVHINRLREKIEDDPQNPRYLQTVWGAGYRFCKKIIAILISAAMHRQIGELRAFEETEEADEGHDGADDISEDHERHIGLFLLGVLIIAGLAGGKAIAVRKKAQT